MRLRPSAAAAASTSASVMSPRSLWCDTGIIAALMDAPALSGLDATSATPPSIGTSGLFGWDAGNATAAAVTSTGDGSIAAWDTIWRADHSTAVASGCSADMLIKGGADCCFIAGA